MQIGWRQFRANAGAIAWIGVAGTLATAAALALAAHKRAYEIIFVVVAFSVVVQGSAVPILARRLGLPLRTVNPRPWTMNARFEEEPESLHRYTVTAGSAADGATVAGLPSDDLWVSVIIRRGRLVTVTPETRLRAGDEVLVLAEPETTPGVAALFRSDPLGQHSLSRGPTATGRRYFRSASLWFERLAPLSRRRNTAGNREFMPM
jgi:NhaP-type Na+/H+ and K+/H+ antiporter